MTTNIHRGPRPTPARAFARTTIAPEASPELVAIREAIRAQDAQLAAAADAMRDAAGSAPLRVSPSDLRAIAEAAEAHAQRAPLGWPWT